MNQRKKMNKKIRNKYKKLIFEDAILRLDLRFQWLKEEYDKFYNIVDKLNNDNFLDPEVITWKSGKFESLQSNLGTVTRKIKKNGSNKKKI